MAPPTDPPLHAGAEPLAFLLGTWRGEGNGQFHTIGPFVFEEEIRFSHRGRPWLVYEQRAWSPEDGSPLHTEMGIWRMVDEGRVNSFVALTAGVDFSDGSLEGTTISLEVRSAPMADGIEPVTGLTRNYRVDGDTRFRPWSPHDM
jgi:hypothetical protein